MTNTRKNKDIKYVIIHHTGLSGINVGLDLNKLFIKNGLFGVPYDILINFDGSIDLSSRWTNGISSDDYVINCRLKDIFIKYNIHHLSGLDITDYNKNGLHIAIIGDFDLNSPTILQYSSLRKLISEIVLRLGLSLNTSLLYYSEIYNTTSPGNLFINKIKLL
jgi:hypothetical protein